MLTNLGGQVLFKDHSSYLLVLTVNDLTIQSLGLFSLTTKVHSNFAGKNRVNRFGCLKKVHNV